MQDDDSGLPAGRELGKFTSDLIADLTALRAGKITLSEARVRAQLAREVLRSIHLQLQGFRALSQAAKQIGASAE